MAHFVAFFLRPSSPLFANDQVSKFCQFYARWCCSAVHSSSTNETTGCSKEPACFWHSLAVCQHVSIFFADIWRESGQAELSGFSWQRTSHKNWSCRRQAEGGQQHQQVSFPESHSWIALQSWSKNRGTSVGIGVRWFWNDWGNDEQAVWIFFPSVSHEPGSFSHLWSCWWDRGAQPSVRSGLLNNTPIDTRWLFVLGGGGCCALWDIW